MLGICCIVGDFINYIYLYIIKIITMFGVKESREPIRGEFAKKLLEEVQRMLKLKKEGKDLHFENKERERKYNIIIRDENEI